MNLVPIVVAKSDIQLDKNPLTRQEFFKSCMIKHNSPFLIFLRPTILFLIANILTYTIHEFSHALTAYAMGIPAELFPFYTNISKTIGTATEKALISIIGPFVSLFIGLACLLAFKQFRSPALKLFLLYAYILNVSIFLGNMFSASMAGDFNRFFNLLELGTTIKLIITILGLILLIWFMFSVGKKFLKFKFSDQNSKTQLVFYTIIIPWVLGTALLIVFYLPLPGTLITGIILSSLFWIFTAIGAWKSNVKSEGEMLRLQGITMIEIIFLFLCVGLIRFLTNGINFLPST